MKVFQEVNYKGYKFAIILDDYRKRAYEAVMTEDGWETDFSYAALGINSFDIAGLLDFKKVEELGYIICE